MCDSQGGERGARSRIPEFDLVILAPRDQEPFGRMPFDALDVPPVS